mgnify:CR=1 FL=1
MKVLYYSGIILFFYYIYKNFYKNKGLRDVVSLWTKYHPDEILDKKMLKIMLNNDTKVFKNLYQMYTLYNINKISDFLNKHYSELNEKNTTKQIFLENKMNWLLNTPHNQFKNISHLPRNKWNIGLKKNNKLISLICVRPIKTIVFGVKMNSFYIDYECTHKNYRYKKLGTLMALKGIEEVVNSDFDSLFYIIDNRRYIQKHICVIKYYSLSLKNIKVKSNDLEPFSPKNIKQAFNLYVKLINKKKIYQLFTIKEFIYYFKPNNEFIYTFVSHKTLCLVHVQCVKYKSFYIKIPTISLFLTNGNHKKELKKVFDKLKELRFNNVIILNTYKIKKFKNKNFEGQSYVYNFNLKTKFKKVKPINFGIPIF